VHRSSDFRLAAGCLSMRRTGCAIIVTIHIYIYICMYKTDSKFVCSNAARERANNSNSARAEASGSEIVPAFSAKDTLRIPTELKVHELLPSERLSSRILFGERKGEKNVMTKPARRFLRTAHSGVAILSRRSRSQSSLCMLSNAVR